MLMTTLQTAPQPTTWLAVLWFILIAVLWIGFFFLEGFDFGVSMLYPFLGKDERERRVMVNTIGPTWDANEVWLLTAGGATFAAFPGWYATLFSGLYLPLFLVLFGLIIRGISFEYRAKFGTEKSANIFDWCSTIGSFIVPLVFGVGFANFIRGLRVGEDMLMPVDFVQRFVSLFNPFGLIGGVTFVVLFAAHGAVFLALKTSGDIRERAGRLAEKLGLAAAVLVAVFLIWANLVYPTSNIEYTNAALFNIGVWVFAAVAILPLLIAVFFEKQRREGFAFIMTGVSILGLMVTVFLHMYGTLGFRGADLNTVGSLNIATAASSELTLTLMAIFATCLVPVVLIYTAWVYWVFRKRISVENIPGFKDFVKSGARRQAPAESVEA